MCWAGSFVIDWLISAGGGLLYILMEMWSPSKSTGTTDFIVRVDKKLWVGSWLFKNCNSLLGTQRAVFGGKSFDHTDGIALPDDAAGYSSTLVDWGRICIMELSCKRFCAWIWFLAKFDKFWTSLKCYCILALNFCWVFPACAFPVLLHLIL